VQTQTLTLALAAALYPLGLLAVSLLLASEKPMRLGLSFYAGAVTTLFLVGTVVIVVLHGAGANSSASARGGFRVGVGTAMLVVAWVLSRRPPKKREPNTAPSWQVRLRGAKPGTVFVTGALLYSPSGSYLGAVTQIATSSGGWPAELQLAVVIAIVLVTVEVPLLAYALQPEATARILRRVEGWVNRHGRQALITALVLVGGYLFIDGLTLVA
jgi:hypothetical protein